MNIDWTQGWLSIDDCLIEKPFAKEIEGVYWQYSSKLNDYAKGLNITVLTWSNGKLCHIKECKSLLHRSCKLKETVPQQKGQPIWFS